MPCRTLKQVIPAIATSDGAGVKLLRSLGQSQQRLDPFLMLDEFSSMNADNYIAGFPDHPHRGFETITIAFQGEVEHADSTGNGGVIGPGDVQWMTAGRGIIQYVSFLIPPIGFCNRELFYILFTPSFL